MRVYDYSGRDCLFLRLKAAMALSVVILALGCTPAIDEYPSLVNAGMLPLSDSNPYLGANLFVAREANRSSELYNFLHFRGGPTAIELLKEDFSAPRMLLFYLNEREVYVATLDDRKGRRRWIVKGPTPLERTDYRALMSTQASLASEPQFIIGDRPVRFHRTSKFPLPHEELQILSPAVPTPIPTPAPKRVVHRSTTVIKAPSEGSGANPSAPATPISDRFVPLNSDQQAIQMSKGFAERASDGDVIHTVEGDSQSFDEIAQWYTKGRLTGAELAEFNGLPKETPVVKGMRIRIPRLKVQDFKRLTVTNKSAAQDEAKAHETKSEVAPLPAGESLQLPGATPLPAATTAVKGHGESASDGGEVTEVKVKPKEPPLSPTPAKGGTSAESHGGKE